MVCIIFGGKLYMKNYDIQKVENAKEPSITFQSTVIKYNDILFCINHAEVHKHNCIAINLGQLIPCVTVFNLNNVWLNPAPTEANDITPAIQYEIADCGYILILNRII